MLTAKEEEEEEKLKAGMDSECPDTITADADEIGSGR